MGKVIKIILQILSSLVLAAVILPFVVALLLNINTVQNFIAQKAVGFAARKLGTEVALRSIRITGFNRVELNGFYVEDYRGDTLLYAEALAVNLNKAALLKGNIVLGDVLLRGGRLNLYQPSEGEVNIKEIVDRISPRDSLKEKSATVILLDDVNIEGFRFAYRRDGAPHKAGGIDFADMSLHDLNVRSRRLRIAGDTIAMDLEGLAFRERSGFAVDDLSTDRFSIVGSSLCFDGLTLRTPYSYLDIPRLRIAGRDWSVFKYFTDSVRIEARMAPSALDSRTLAWFAPSLALDEPLKATRLALTFEGAPNDFAGRLSSAEVAGTFLKMDYAVRGVTNFGSASFRIGLDTLQTDGASVIKLMHTFAGGAPDKTMEAIGRLGTIGLKGRFEGGLGALSADASLATSLGALALKGDAALPPDGGKDFQGRIWIHGFDVGGLLGNRQIGRLFASATVNAQDIATERMSADASVEVSGFRFAQHVYRGVELTGALAGRSVTGRVVSRDPDASLELDGFFDFREEVLPRYDFMLDVRRLDLAALGFVKADSVALLSLSVSARGMGLDPDDFTGTIVVRDLNYATALDTMTISRIRLAGDNGPEKKYLSLTSPVADAEFRSFDSYRKVFGYLRGRLASYLPGLESGIDRIGGEAVPDAADINGYSTLTVDLHNADKATAAFVPALNIADSTRLRLSLNPQADKFLLTLHSPYVEWNRFLVSGLDLSVQNVSDSLVMRLRTSDTYAGSYRMPALSVQAGAKNNLLDVSAGFGTAADKVSAMLGLTASFGGDSLGAPRVTLRFRPSSVRQNGSVWHIMAREIAYDSTLLRIDGFRIVNGGQGLYVDGSVSASRADTLHVRLASLSLDPLSQLTSEAGYRFAGVLNGRGDLISARNNPILTARLDMDSLEVNGVAVAPLLFDSRWDFGTERARFSLLNKRTRRDVIAGYYRPGDGAYMAKAELDNLPLVLLDQILKGVLRDTEGFANATLEVRSGEGRPVIDGEIKIPHLTTTVDFTGAAYRLDSGLIVVKDNVFTLRPDYLYDMQGNRAAFTMTFDARNFANLAYQVSVKPDHFIALNTTAEENDIFYGRVYASGTVTVKGDKRGIDMDIVAATDDNSIFEMPLKGTSSVTDADFITFVHRQRPDTANYLVRRRMMYERRMRGPTTQTDMNINMALNVRQNTELELQIDPTVDNTLRARGNGQLNLHVNPGRGDFTIYGNYEITEGSYTFSLENLVTKKFEIQSGSSIQWSGDPLDAILNITAVYKLRTSLASLFQSDEAGLTRNVQVDCIIKLTGRLSQPTITFDVSVPNASPEIQSLLADILNTTQEMMATQFLYLLVFNQFYTDNGSSSTNIGAMSGGSIGFGFLTNQINKLLSSEDFSVNVSYRQKSDITSDEVDLTVQKELWNDRLILEFEGNYDTGNNPTSTANRNTNITAGGTITWVVDRSGRLLIKIFSRTIDRFDENQGLQENGVGIYFSQDFDTFKELWGRFRAKLSAAAHRSDERRAARLKRPPRRKAAGKGIPSPPAAGSEERDSARRTD